MTMVLREVPGDSVVHRLWAGTKLIAAGALSVLLMALPTWPTLGLVAGFLIVTGAVAGVPPSALPRPPRWVWALIALGGALNAVVGTAALVNYIQTVVLASLLFVGALVISWTTPMSDVAPAIATLARPLRRLGVPVDEWAVALALCLRSLPMLLEEMRVLRAARRLRPHNLAQYRDRREHPLVDIITATMAVSLRRAGELGEAITARGGTGQLAAHPTAPRRADAVALTTVALVCGLGGWLGSLAL
jgi:energy-coupling factor transport system permease protein